MLLGNLVAKKCEATKSAHHRRLILFLHELSLRAGCRKHPTSDSFPAWPWDSDISNGCTAFECVAKDVETLFQSVIKKRSAVARLPKFLTELCLDPRKPVEGARLDGFAGIIETLESYRVAFCEAARQPVALTGPTLLVWESLDYALQQGGMVLVEGTWRVGKSYSAQSWAQSHGGECRYVQLSSSRDDTSFYRDIARALGVACSTQRKASEMRMRIESMLRTQGLLMILDEAQYIWPQSLRPQTPPERANWLISALLNSGVPVALIASKDFSRMMENVRLKCPVAGLEQFDGRLRLRTRLPDNLIEADLFKIVKAVMPEASESVAMLLVGHALKAKGRISAIEAAVARARFFAQRDGRTVTFQDIERAIADASGATSPHVRRASAAGPRPHRECAADPERPAPVDSIVALSRASHSSPIPSWPGMFAGARGSD
jgi:hypothetical protein